MSLGMFKMYVSFVGMALLIISIGLILLARHKLSGIFGGMVAFFAYICFIFGGIIIFYIVFSGPTV